MRYSALYSSTRSLYGVYIKKYLWGKKKEIMQIIPAGHFNNYCLNLSVQFRVGLLVRISQLNEMNDILIRLYITMIVASIKEWIQFLIIGSSGISRFAVSVLQGV